MRKTKKFISFLLELRTKINSIEIIIFHDSPPLNARHKILFLLSFQWMPCSPDLKSGGGSVYLILITIKLMPKCVMILNFLGLIMWWKEICRYVEMVCLERNFGLIFVWGKNVCVFVSVCSSTSFSLVCPVLYKALLVSCSLSLPFLLASHPYI